MPPLTFTGSVRTLNGRRHEDVRVELRGDVLLENGHLGRLVRDDLTNGTAPLDVREFITDAMAGMQSVIAAYTAEVGGQVQNAWSAIDSLAVETAPGRPLLARLADDLSLSAASFDDLLVSSVLRADLPEVRR